MQEAANRRTHTPSSAHLPPSCEQAVHGMRSANLQITKQGCTLSACDTAGEW